MNSQLPGAEFTYAPLPRGEFFRYLVLNPGQGNEPLVCRLVTSNFTREARYEAISYVWGSNERPYELRIATGDLETGTRRLGVTANLHAALRDLRLPSEPRALWADLICINQADVAERGHQVAVMNKVYSRAVRVLICLGEDASGCGPLAASLIDHVNRMILRETIVAKRSRAAIPHLQADDPLLTDTRWKAMATLLDQPWFWRGWVVQEAGLASQATLVWGAVRIPWLHLVRLHFWVLSRASRLSRFLDFSTLEMHTMLYRKRHAQAVAVFGKESDHWTRLKIPEVLGLARGLKLTDDRDRIFAFLGVGAQFGQQTFSIQPNYNISALEVYLDFAQQYLRTTQDLTLLEQVQHNEETIEADYPSWVPRWNLQRHTCALGYLGDGAITPGRRTLPSQQRLILRRKSLQVRGILLGRIAWASRAHGAATVSAAEVAKVWRHAAAFEPNPYDPSLRSLVFVDTLTVCRLHREWKTRADLRVAYVRYLELISDFGPPLTELYAANGAESTTPFEHYTFDLVHNLTRNVLQGRRFIVTDKGYFGLAPGPARDGDACCIIFGCKTQFVLREVGDAGSSLKKRYKVLGEAFLASKRHKDHEQEGYPTFDGLGWDARTRDWEEWRDVQEQNFVLV